MTSRPGSVLLVLLCMIAGAAAGCLGESKQSDVAATSATGPTTGSNVTFEAPVADFYAAPNPVLEGALVSFDAANAYDPEGGNLTYAWDFGDGSADDGLAVEHAYGTAGSFLAVLSARSDASNLSGEASLTIRVLDESTLKQPLTFTDPDDDGALDYSDITKGLVYDSGGFLWLQVTLQDLYESYDSASVIMLDFTINDVPFEVYGLDGELGVWDFSRQADVPDAQVLLDAEANTILVQAPLAELGATEPFALYLETRIGEPKVLHGQHTDDRAPDTGAVTYPG